MKKIMFILFALPCMTSAIVMAAELNNEQNIELLVREAIYAGIKMQEAIESAATNASFVAGHEISEADKKIDKTESVFHEKVDCLRTAIMASPSMFEKAIEIIRSHKDEDIRKFLQIWGTSDVRDSELLDKIFPLLNDSDPQMRTTAIYALTPKRKRNFSSWRYGDIQSPPTQLNPDKSNIFSDYEIENNKARAALLARLRVERKKDIKLDIIWSLAFSQALDQKITEAFLEVLKEEGDIQVKRELVRELVLGGLHDNAAHVLIEYFKNCKDHNIQSSIVLAIGTPTWRHFAEPVKEELYNALIDTLRHGAVEELRRDAVFTLGSLYPAPKRLHEDLNKVLLTEKSEQVRDEIKRILK